MISKIFKNHINSEKIRENMKIVSEINEAKRELDRLIGIFNLTQNGLQSERLIFQIKAAEIKYRYICNFAKENTLFNGISDLKPSKNILSS